jgi:hypothetical protein
MTDIRPPVLDPKAPIVEVAKDRSADGMERMEGEAQ